MSRFTGPQGHGAQHRARELRMYQAYLRQVDGNLRQHTVVGQPWAYADPANFLTAAARQAVAAGHIDIDSWRGSTKP